MLPGELKPILSTLVLPPGGPLLLCALGFWLARRRQRLGRGLVAAGLLALAVLACPGTGVLLLRHALPAEPPITAAALARAQAIVVLGGGVHDPAPEYGSAQPSGATLARLRYGAHLARQSKLPLAFAGGVGWGGAAGKTPESEVAVRILQEWGLALRWSDGRSRDTAENASEMAHLLRPEGVRRIALVTDAWHLPRARLAFERAGFEVVGAPTGLPGGGLDSVLAWLPSADGLAMSRTALRERLALLVAGA